jgi:hypothetical protein
VRKHDVAVFEYRVPLETSVYIVQYASDSGSGRDAIRVAYHGRVAVDRQSHMVLQVSQAAEIPRDFPVTVSSSQIDYDYFPIAGEPYLLPASAKVSMATKYFRAENDVEFLDYRKFHSEATITFGAEAGADKAPEEKK